MTKEVHPLTFLKNGEKGGTGDVSDYRPRIFPQDVPFPTKAEADAAFGPLDEPEGEVEAPTPAGPALP